jgi:hypothetical protein
VAGELASPQTTIGLGGSSRKSWSSAVIELGGPAFVMMVQSAGFSNFDDLTFSGRLGSSELRSVFAERQMRAPTVVIEKRFSTSR